MNSKRLHTLHLEKFVFDLTIIHLLNLVKLFSNKKFINIFAFDIHINCILFVQFIYLCKQLNFDSEVDI